MHKNSILLVEDNEDISNIVIKALKDEEYKIVCAKTGREGIALSSSLCPDLILLDLGLPDMEGIEIISNVRSWTNLPIIVISARLNEIDKVSALDAGADDYLTKPFGILELKARIRSLLRRNNVLNSSIENIFRVRDIVIDCDNQTVNMNDKVIELTNIEYKLLLLLVQNKGRVMTYSKLKEQIWGPYADHNNQILRVNMANIRKKIEEDSSSPLYIYTENGVGYKMME